jgi:hypothetical protein
MIAFGNLKAGLPDNKKTEASEVCEGAIGEMGSFPTTFVYPCSFPLALLSRAAFVCAKSKVEQWIGLIFYNN